MSGDATLTMREVHTQSPPPSVLSSDRGPRLGSSWTKPCNASAGASASARRRAFWKRGESKKGVSRSTIVQVRDVDVEGDGGGSRRDSTSISTSTSTSATTVPSSEPPAYAVTPPSRDAVDTPALARTPTIFGPEVILTSGPGDTIIIKKLEPPKAPLSSVQTLCYYLLAFFLPPLAVALLHGGRSHHTGINYVLTLFGWLPGSWHAMSLVNEQNRYRIVHRRIHVSEIGLFSALQGYDRADGQPSGGGIGMRTGSGSDYRQVSMSVAVGPMFEREYLPVLDKSGNSW